MYFVNIEQIIFFIIKYLHLLKSCNFIFIIVSNHKFSVCVCVCVCVRVFICLCLYEFVLK